MVIFYRDKRLLVVKNNYFYIFPVSSNIQALTRPLPARA